MKTSLFAAAALVAAARTAEAKASYPTLTAQQQITLFNPEDFAFTLGGPEPDASVNGFQIRAATLGQLPALEGQGIAMALVNLDACSINLPHVHPRATEMQYILEGNIRTAFVEENGGEGAVVNDLYRGDVTFIPQGLIHYEQNLGCEPAAFLAALNNEDPGAVTITTRFFELPTEAIQASLNSEDPALQTLIESLPEAPAAARRECLIMCGLLDDGGDEGIVEEMVDDSGDDEDMVDDSGDDEDMLNQMADDSGDDDGMFDQADDSSDDDGMFDQADDSGDDEDIFGQMADDSDDGMFDQADDSGDGLFDAMVDDSGDDALSFSFSFSYEYYDYNF